MSEKAEVDCACYCKDCERGGERRFYRMNVSCGNCTGDYITKHRFGDKTSTSVKCPLCGVSFRAIYVSRVA